MTPSEILLQKSRLTQLLSGGMHKVFKFFSDGNDSKIFFGSEFLRPFSNPEFVGVLHNQFEFGQTSRSFDDSILRSAGRPKGLFLVGRDVEFDDKPDDDPEASSEAFTTKLYYVMPHAFIHVRHHVPDYCDESWDAQTFVDVYVSEDIEVIGRLADDQIHVDKGKLKDAMSTIREDYRKQLLRMTPKPAAARKPAKRQPK